MKTHLTYITAGILLGMASCGNGSGTQNRAPIKLGDSSSIVMEKDSQFLKDDVMDIEPRSAAHADSSAGHSAHKEESKPVKDTVAATAKKEPEEAGHGVEFGGTKLVWTGLSLKDARKQNAEKDDGLTYTLQSGSLGSARLVVYGGKNITVKQRYQTKLVLKSSLGTVDLRDLGLYTSGWNTVKASGPANAASFSLTGLNEPGYTQINNNKIKTATDRELRKRRTNSRVIQSWMKEIKGVRSADDDPCEIILDNVQWQVSGTDAKGRTFHKTIRLDA